MLSLWLSKYQGADFPSEINLYKMCLELIQFLSQLSIFLPLQQNAEEKSLQGSESQLKKAILILAEKYGRYGYLGNPLNG
jgi:hypothetical protein